MQVWKRRLVALVAVAAGSAGLMSTAGAQTPPEFPEIPGFSIPDFSIPDFTIPGSSIPPFPTIPPPTMPPPTSPTTSTPPPTMPPSTTVTTIAPPPTMPPPTFPSTSIPTPTVPSPGDLLDEFFEDLINRFEQGGETFDELRSILDDIIASF